MMSDHAGTHYIDLLNLCEETEEVIKALMDEKTTSVDTYQQKQYQLEGKP